MLERGSPRLSAKASHACWLQSLNPSSGGLENYLQDRVGVRDMKWNLLELSRDKSLHVIQSLSQAKSNC